MPKTGKLACLIAVIFILLGYNFGSIYEVYAENKPSIIFKETIHNFGNVLEGAKVQHDFVVSNKGDADLLIQRVVAGCGCTAVAAVNEAVAPGADSKVSVTFDTTGMSGSQTKSVRIYSNDPSNPISTISISGAVQQKVSVQPTNVLFEGLTRGQKDPAIKNVTITTEPSSGIKIGNIESFSKFIKIEGLTGSEYEKKFSVSLDTNLPLGDFRDRIIVNLSGSSKSSINIPVYANVKGYLQLNPPAVSFGIISGKDPLTKKVSLENKSDKPYILKSIESSHPALSAKIAETRDGKVFNIDITLDPKKVTSDLRTELKFKAETDLEESVSVNVYGVLPPKV